MATSKYEYAVRASNLIFINGGDVTQMWKSVCVSHSRTPGTHTASKVQSYGSAVQVQATLS